MKKIFFVSFSIIVCFATIIAVNADRYKPRTAPFSESEEEEKNGIAGAIDFFKKVTANRVTGSVDLNDVIKARAAIETQANARSQAAVNLVWDEVGPNNVGGRTRAFMVDKDSASILYAGSVAGGMWKSRNGGASWFNLYDNFENNAITCITQAANGDLYVGTGEGLYEVHSGTGAGGVIGGGVWKSTDRGDHWSRLASTIPATLNSASSAYVFINEIAADHTNPLRIYMATNVGLRVSDDGGTSWFNPIHTSDASKFAADVAVGFDGTVIASINDKAYISSNGNDATFTNLSTGASGMLPLSSDVSRIEFAFTPLDANYIYASIADASGALKGIYKTTNKGTSWSVPGGVSFQPFGNQGGYDNSIAVSPLNKNQVYVAGTQLWQFSNFTWGRLGEEYPGPSSQYKYVHADKHKLVFSIADTNSLYVSCDGGVFKSSNIRTKNSAGPSFKALNNGYNVTQFYAVGSTKLGEIFGGTQDNGTKFMDYDSAQVSPQPAKSIGGGDGGTVAASVINQDFIYYTIDYGNLYRSLDHGASSNQFYNSRIRALPNFGDVGFAGFVTPIAMFESFKDSLSQDSISYTIKATDNTAAGATIQIPSKVQQGTNQKYFSYTNPTNYSVGQIIKVQDVMQNRLAVGLTNSVWITKDAINTGVNTRWMKIAKGFSSSNPNDFSGEVKVLKFSKNGDVLFVGTMEGNLYRISNLKSISYSDTLTGEIGDPACQLVCRKIASFGFRTVSGIAIDQNNADRIVVTLGNYGNTNYVFNCNNALATTPTFTVLQSNLPSMPVYDAVIDMNHANTILLATEYGVWASDDNGASWSQSAGFPNVPVFYLFQQTWPWQVVPNSGVIYAATHGRGIFRTTSLVGIHENTLSKSKDALTVTVFPNPSHDFVTIGFLADKRTNAVVKIYSLSGHLISEKTIVSALEGNNNVSVSVVDYAAGTYFVSVTCEGKTSTAKFVLMK